MINSSNAIPTYEEVLKLNRMVHVTHYNPSSLNYKIVFNTDGYSNLNLMYNSLDSKILSTGQGFGYLYMSRSSNVQMFSTPIYFDTANPNTVIISRCWLPDTPTMVECDVQIRLYRQLTGEIKICEPNSDEPLDSITASVNEHIAHMLTTEARRLLDCTDLPVKQIAYRLGFADQASFGKFFRKQFGVSPTEYRAGRRT